MIFNRKFNISFICFISIIFFSVNANAIGYPDATTLDATNITLISATIRGLVNPNGIDTQVSFASGDPYGSISYFSPTPVQNIGNGNVPVEVFYTLTGLSPGTNYSYGVTAQNGAGVTNGGVYKFTTLYPAPTTPAPTTPAPTTPVPTTPAPTTPVPILIPLKVTIISEPSNVEVGQISTITVTVTGDGKEIAGASVFMASKEGKVYSATGTTDFFGQVTSTFMGYVEGIATVSVLARKEGYEQGKGDVRIPVVAYTPTLTPPLKQRLISDKVIPENFNNTTAQKEEYGTVLKSENVVEQKFQTDWWYIYVIIIMVVLVVIFYPRQNIHIDEYVARDKIGHDKVKINDSFIKNSTIGASGRKCPNCGREVGENERSCKECGAKL